MISYEKALAKANELLKGIDHCLEYEDAYVFSVKKYEDEIGGNHQPCVILKKDGRAVTLVHYYMNSSGEEIREFDI